MAARHLLVSGAAILCTVFAGCNSKGGDLPKPPPPIVSVSKPVETEVVDNYYFEGYTAAVATVDIRARVTGYLSKIYFKDGDDVKEGAPLFLIDPRPYKAQLDQTEAELAQVKAQMKRLDADLARAEKLLAQRAVSKEDYDKIAADRAEAAATIKAREASIEKANLDLHFAAIKVPITGQISRALVTEGNLVSANTTLLTTIVSIDPIYAYFDVDEPTVLRFQEMIRQGKLESVRDVKVSVFLGLDINQDYPYEGTIDFIENRIDPKTGTLKLRAVFANPKRTLTPGLHARIRAPVGKPYQGLAISERAIGSNQGQKFVYVVDDKNVVVYRPVTLGTLQGKLRVITEGLTKDERVIVNGLQRVRPGITVNPTDAEMTAQRLAHDASGTLAGR